MIYNYVFNQKFILYIKHIHIIMNHITEHIKKQSPIIKHIHMYETHSCNYFKKEYKIRL